MKNLTIVIHAGAQQVLADCLRTLQAVKGFTFTHVEGHSDHSAEDPFLSARDKVVGYVPRVRVDVLLEDEDVGGVLDALCAQHDLRGQGVFWVTAVEREGRL
jgi:nitrogen regulatory protein P-II 1